MRMTPEQIATGNPYAIETEDGKLPDLRMVGEVAATGKPFDVALIQHVHTTEHGGSLWQGGCVDGVPLSDDFDFVLSLYPWEKYELGELTHRMEITMYDSRDQGTEQADGLADLVVERLTRGQQVLIHCQAGLNRSSLVTAVTLVKLGFKPGDAVDLLRSERSDQVLCNPSFEEAIRNLEVPA